MITIIDWTVYLRPTNPFSSSSLTKREAQYGYPGFGAGYGSNFIQNYGYGSHATNYGRKWFVRNKDQMKSSFFLVLFNWKPYRWLFWPREYWHRKQPYILESWISWNFCILLTFCNSNKTIYSLLDWQTPISLFNSVYSWIAVPSSLGDTFKGIYCTSYAGFKS